MISVVASLTFFYVVLNMFTVQYLAPQRNPWRVYLSKVSQNHSTGSAPTVTAYTVSAVLLDAPSSWQMNFQVPATEIMEKIVDLHHDLMFFIVVIVVFVS